VLTTVLILLIALVPLAIDLRWNRPLKVPLTYGSLAVFVTLGVAVAGNDRTRLGNVVAAGVLTALYCSFSIWLRTQQHSGAVRAREEALLLGVRVEEVVRDVPYFEGPTKVKLEKETCTKYSLPRRVSGYPPKWRFFLRPIDGAVEYPNGWFFRASPDAPPPAEMNTVLREIADAVDEGFLEFEADAREVAAFWTEWGGVDEARRLHRWLQALGRA
jgi:hypothetical protein